MLSKLRYQVNTSTSGHIKRGSLRKAQEGPRCKTNGYTHMYACIYSSIRRFWSWAKTKMKNIPRVFRERKNVYLVHSLYSSVRALPAEL